MVSLSLARPAPIAACRAARTGRCSTTVAAQRLQHQRQQVQQRRRVRPSAGRGGGPDRDSDSEGWVGAGLTLGGRGALAAMPQLAVGADS